MASLWFSADTHYGHFNIIRYCNRPFKTLEQMNETLIRNYNQRVKPDDTCIFVGDFCFRNSSGGKVGEGASIHSKQYIAQLLGNKVFIKGNHDSKNSLDTKIERATLRVGGIYINVCHNPEDAIIEDSQQYYPLNLVGHVHNNWATKEIYKDGKYSLLINVGVDVCKFYPIHFDEVKAIYDKWYCNHPQRANINRLIIKGQ